MCGAGHRLAICAYAFEMLNTSASEACVCVSCALVKGAPLCLSNAQVYAIVHVQQQLLQLPPAPTCTAASSTICLTRCWHRMYSVSTHQHDGACCARHPSCATIMMQGVYYLHCTFLCAFCGISVHGSCSAARLVQVCCIVFVMRVPATLYGCPTLLNQCADYARGSLPLLVARHALRDAFAAIGRGMRVGWSTAV
jgi:hypothetical protein